MAESNVLQVLTAIRDDPRQLLLLVGAIAILYFLSNYVLGNGLAAGFEGVGVKNHSFTLLPAKFRFLSGGRDLMYRAMQRLQRPFYVCAMEGPTIIIPAKYIEEIKNRKPMSFNGWFKRSFVSNYPGFEGNRITTDSNVMKDAVRTKLTQSLGPVSLDLCEQADMSVKEIYGQPTGWTAFDTRKHGLNLIATLSTRVFLGKRLTKNPEWIRVTVDYTINMMLAVRTLKLVPPALQPILHWVIPHCYLLRRDNRSGRKIVAEEIETRRKERKAKDEAGTPASKSSDSIGWMEEIAAGKPFDLAGAQLQLTFAAVHTTSDMLTKSLYYLAADPAIADAVRKEAAEILTTEGWKKTSLTKMRFLDSLMKEVQRLHPTNLFGLPRWTEDDVHFKDGTTIPKGNLCAILSDGMRDPSIYSQPDTFDAWRFAKLAKDTGDNNHWQFVTTSPEHFGFGHGIHACPGRFFAANEIKISLIFLLMHYEWRVVDLEKRLAAKKEPTISLGSDCILDPSLKFEYRARKPEIDIMNCYDQVKAES